MSHEIFQLMQTMDIKKIELQLSLQCAPVLAGLKASNLFVIDQKNAGDVLDLFRKTRFQVRVLYQNDERTTFLVYQADRLASYLFSSQVWKILKTFGYELGCLDEVLDEFSKRYARYMQGSAEFPHEMGLMLEYPMEDVLGFIENEGKNSLYTGYWKVYGNLEEKLALFQQFNQAKEQLICLISKDVDVLDVIAYFRTNSIKQAVC